MYIELYHIKNDKSIDNSLNYLKYDKKVTIWSVGRELYAQ